jgi:AraC-like DNA-binding protein
MEVRYPIGRSRPIWVKQEDVLVGQPVPAPSVAHPEWHPYCELNFVFAGRLRQYVGGESAERAPGSLMLLGSGTPHYAVRLSYPQRSVTVYFMPTVLLEMGPEGDGAHLLSRCSAPTRISDRIVRLPPAVRRRLAARFEEMIAEFSQPRSGSEVRLRSLLVEILVEVVRHEEEEGRKAVSGVLSRGWLHVGKAIQYIHHHFSEPVYIHDIAEAAGVSDVRLQEYFQATLAMSCIQYLCAYRLSRAAALLSEPGARVTEVAMSVGFETLSHFNASFRKHTGKSPTEYMQRQA